MPGPASISRRQFLLAAPAAAAVAGCAINPVTGKRQLMLVGEQQEIALDRQRSPHQFSADYGAVQDPRVNQYVAQVGQAMSPRTHRPQMPYNFRCVNASYVNAYTFPGGSMAATRGILLHLNNEAELAGLLGHELGHVNARHTAARMSKGMLIGGLVAGVGAALGEGNKDTTQLVTGLGGLGSGLLMAQYSRDDERQADQLGMQYMVAGGYTPSGMIGVMDVLRNLKKREPSAIERMFASHPMSEERYRTAVGRANAQYAAARGLPVHRERYMDHTASVRRLGGVIKAVQRGDRAVGQKQLGQAQQHYANALGQAQSDYEALVKMAKCQMAQKRHAEAYRYAAAAQTAYPQEAQAHHVGGLACIALRRFDQALNHYNRYDTILPGNPNVTFFKGLAYEGMGNRQNAAQRYQAFLKSTQSGNMAKHAYSRLVQWGYITPAQPRG